MYILGFQQQYNYLPFYHLLLFCPKIKDTPLIECKYRHPRPGHHIRGGGTLQIQNINSNIQGIPIEKYVSLITGIFQYTR